MARNKPTSADSPAAAAWRAIFGVMFKGKPRFPAIAHEFGLTPQQLATLRMLGAEGPVPMHAIADTLYCDASNVTGIVDRLEARGLVERQADPSDRRVKLLAITKAGDKLRQQAFDRIFEPPPELDRLTATEQRQLSQLLNKAFGSLPE